MPTKSRFVVMEHDAKKARLHYDVRFVMPNSKLWASFACRKPIPLQPGTRILAVRTHDHGEEEALMLGTIPEGSYGAGVLKDWDHGDCIVEIFKSSHMAVTFKGKKMKGLYHFINIGNVKGKSAYKNQDFMLFKGKK